MRSPRSTALLLALAGASTPGSAQGLALPPQCADPALESYVAHVAAAEGALRAGDAAAMRRWLDAVPEELRGFEWRWLSARSDRSRRALSPHAGSSVTAIALSPDGARYATGAADGSAKVWDAATDALQLSLDAHPRGVHCVAWSPDGARLATSGADLAARVWDARSGALLSVFEGHGAPVTTVRFSPPGDLMASTGYTRPAGGEVRIWDPETGEEVLHLQDGYAPITTSHWSPDGEKVAAASWDQHYRVFTLARPAEPLVARIGSEDVYRAAQASALSPDGELIAIGGKDDEVHLFRAWTAEPVRDLVGHAKWVEGVAFSPDGALVASASADGSVGLWDVTSGKRLARLLGHRGGVRPVAFSPDGEEVLSGGDDGTLRFWSVRELLHGGREGGARERISLDVTPYFALESPGGDVVAVSAHQGRLELFSTRDGRSARVLREDGGWLNWLDFDAEGARLLAAGDEGVLLWDLASGERIAHLEASGIESAAFSPDGRSVVATGRDRKCRVWDVASGEPRFELELEKYQSACAFAPDGRAVFFGGLSPAAVYDAESGAELHALAGQRGRVRAADYHPGGEQLATASDDGTIRVWNRADGALLREIEAHGKGVHAVAFSPDGARLASLGSDDRVRLWETEGYELVLSLDRDGGYNLSWSADGERLWVTPLLDHVYCLDAGSVGER